MKRALIVYFSQRGTNARVAELIAGALRDAGHRVDLWNLKDGRPPRAQDYDVLGVGSPACNFRPPFAVTDYVRGLGDLAGLPAFVFVVHRTGVASRRRTRSRHGLPIQEDGDLGTMREPLRRRSGPFTPS